MTNLLHTVLWVRHRGCTIYPAQGLDLAAEEVKPILNKILILVPLMKLVRFLCLVGFIRTFSTTKLYRIWAPRLTSDNFMCCYTRDKSRETMTSVSVGQMKLVRHPRRNHIIKCEPFPKSMLNKTIKRKVDLEFLQLFCVILGPYSLSATVIPYRIFQTLGWIESISQARLYAYSLDSMFKLDALPYAIHGFSVARAL